MSPKVELRTAKYDHLPGQERPRTVIRPFTLAANSSASIERTSIFLGSSGVHAGNVLTTLVRCRAVAEYAHRRFLRTAGCCSDGRDTGDARYWTILRASEIGISALETGTHLHAMAASHPSLTVLSMLFLLA